MSSMLALIGSSILAFLIFIVYMFDQMIGTGYKNASSSLSCCPLDLHGALQSLEQITIEELVLLHSMPLASALVVVFLI